LRLAVPSATTGGYLDPSLAISPGVARAAHRLSGSAVAVALTYR